MNHKGMIRTLIVAIALMFSASLALADLHWTSQQETKGVPNQPDETVIVNSYYQNNMMRTEEGNEVTIIDYNTMDVYQLDAGNKTYTKTNLDEMMGGSGEEAQAMQAMMSAMLGSLKVTPTNEEKTISGYKCKKYVMSFMIANNEYWVSKEVKGYDELRSLSKTMGEKAKTNPMLKMANFAALMDELDGFPVQMIISAMGSSTTTTLTAIEQKPLPKELFQAPKDYTLQQ